MAWREGKVVVDGSCAMQGSRRTTLDSPLDPLDQETKLDLGSGNAHELWPGCRVLRMTNTSRTLTLVSFHL